MQIAVNTAFAGTASAYGAWFDVAHMSAYSLHIYNLESGGVIKVWGSNQPKQPVTSVVDNFAVLLGTFTAGAALNGFLLSSALGVCHWIQIQKIASGGLYWTNVQLLGQIT